MTAAGPLVVPTAAIPSASSGPSPVGRPQRRPDDNVDNQLLITPAPTWPANPPTSAKTPPRHHGADGLFRAGQFRREIASSTASSRAWAPASTSPAAARPHVEMQETPTSSTKRHRPPSSSSRIGRRHLHLRRHSMPGPSPNTSTTRRNEGKTLYATHYHELTTSPRLPA